MPEFDTIASRYSATASMAIRKALMQTMLHVIGDIKGKAVLDLACGSGMYTRLLKQQGAGKVVGVDISSEMLALAKEEESLAPLGIEYHQGDATSLGCIDKFDLVTASFLLHYAPNQEQLLRMLQTIRANLRPGGHFVTANLNVRLTEGELSRNLAKYGFALRPQGSPLLDGTPVIVTLYLEQGPIAFETYYLSKAVYDRAFAAAGLEGVNWDHPWRFSFLANASLGSDYWDDFRARPVISVLDCRLQL